MKFKLQSQSLTLLILLITVLLTLLLIPTANIHALSEELKDGAAFEKARRSLFSDNIEDALTALQTIKPSSPLAIWIYYLQAEANLSLGRENELGDITSKLRGMPEYKIYGVTLDLENSLLNRKEIEGATLKEYRALVTNYNGSLLKPKINLIDTLLLNTPMEKALSLQQLRKNYPNSLESGRAITLQRHFESPVKLDADYLLEEVRTLQKQFGGEKLSQLLDPILEKIFINWNSLKIGKVAQDELFNATARVLLPLNKEERFLQLKGYLPEKIKIDFDNYSDLEKTRVAWNKNDYKEMESLLKKVPASHPRRVYLKARALEEQRKFEAALKLFKSPVLLKLEGGHFTEIKEESGRRARLLTKLSSPWKKVLPFSADELSNPRSHYYWISKGRSVSDPFVSPTVASEQPKRCELKLPVIPHAEMEKLVRLRNTGVGDLVAEELYRLMPIAKDSSGVLSRAEALSNFGSHAASYTELLKDKSISEEIKKNCPFNYYRILYPKNFIGEALNASKLEGIPSNLLLAIARTESAFSPLAFSRTGARGIMQMMPNSAKQEGFHPEQSSDPFAKLFNPEVSFLLGAKHYNGMLTKFKGSHIHALAAYNGGPNSVTRWQERYKEVSPEIFIELIPFVETREYVKKVLSAYWIYEWLE